MQRRNDTHTSIKNQEKLLKQLKIIVFKQKKYYRMQRESLMVVQHHWVTKHKPLTTITIDWKKTSQEFECIIQTVQNLINETIRIKEKLESHDRAALQNACVASMPINMLDSAVYSILDYSILSYSILAYCSLHYSAIYYPTLT